MMNKFDESIEVLINFPKGKYEITNIISNISELAIELSRSDDEKVKILFGKGVVGFQVYEEECCLHRVYELVAIIGKEVLKNNSVFSIANSKYLKNILDQSNNLYEQAGLLHYLILSSNNVMDIITMGGYSIITT